MTNTYFLGANTPEGFRSEYGTLQRDPRIQRLLIVKGGSGCGKSTLMKTLGTRAEEYGWAVERILCSSDPDSLDGLVIPEAGLALVDGTAPHVVEPALCGCGANYVNLGKYYRETQLRPLIPAIRAAKAANAVCYGPAYGCLRAAAALSRARRQLLGRERIRAVTEEALAQLADRKLPRAETPGGERRVYLSGITPDGLLSLPLGEGRIWAIQDSHGVGGGLIRTLADRWREAGEDVVLAMDPLDPDAPAGVFLPGRGQGWLRVHPAFPGPRQAMLRLDLDAPLEEGLPDSLSAGMEELSALEHRLLREAAGWLRQAKAHHDLIEELYRPAVDFAGVTRETELLCRELFAEVTSDK
ncbi:MAG: hypothetical protein J5789_07925 [Oscillospiraceae bacterium]|nr:hypothetical protein [Oscillospiraceae bacterium]